MISSLEPGRTARSGLVIGCACALLLTGCTADDEPQADTIAYSATPSASGAPPSEPAEGIDQEVEMQDEECLSSGPESAVSPRPSEWGGETTEAIDHCEWVRSDGDRVEFAHGEIDGDAWAWIVRENSQASLPDGDIPGYSIVRYSRNVSGGPVWHYQYVEQRDSGAVYVDSYNIYRGNWRITYEAESSRFNTYVADAMRNDAHVE